MDAPPGARTHHRHGASVRDARLLVWPRVRYTDGELDQDAASAVADFDSRSWGSLIEEFAATRDASIAFFDGLPEDAWDRHGIASGNPVTVRALAWMTAGHGEHHARIVRDRYLQAC